MDMFTGVLIVVAAFGGFVGGTLMSREYWIFNYKNYCDRVSKQYKDILNGFGIRKNGNNTWEMKNRDGCWTKKEG